ncbi:MAG: hypothetical protein IJ313_10640 [Clostridia bacterium]|nr:hypothetical protein [Clostridia bacterium]
MLDLEKMHAIGMIAARQARERAAADYEAANDIIDMSPLLEPWKEGVYKVGDVRTFNGLPIWCMTAHDSTSNPMWTPAYDTALWAQYHGRDAAHALPFKAEGHNPYNTDHWCTENGTAYRCKQDGVVYAPSVLPVAWEVSPDV